MKATKVLSKKTLLIPPIRFEGFSGLWINKQAVDLFSNSRKKGNDSLPIYSVTLDQGMVPRNSLERRMGNDAKSVDNLFVEKNDISYNMMRMWQGAYGLAPENCMVSPAYVVLQPKENVSSEFFIRYFNRSRSLYLFKAFSYGLTSDRLRLYYNDFARIKFAIPDLEEQKKIASFLSAVDEKIQQLTRKKELLEQYKKGMMQQLFSGKLRFKDKNGKVFPKWDMVGGDKLFDSISNKKHNSDLPILAITQDQGAIPREMINYQMSVTDSSIASYKVVQVGDFIISLRTFQGGIEYSNYKGICSPAYNILRPRSDNVNKVFYKYYLKTSSYIMQLQKNLEGIRDGKMISYKYFSEVKLPFPSKEEQKRIANYLSEIDNKIESVNKQIIQTQTFRKGLLQLMFV